MFKLLIGLFVAIIIAAIIETGGAFIIDALIPVMFAVAMIYIAVYISSTIFGYYKDYQREQYKRQLRHRTIVQLNRERHTY